MLTSDLLELLRAMGQTQGSVGRLTTAGRDSCGADTEIRRAIGLETHFSTS